MSSIHHFTVCGFQKPTEMETTGSYWVRGTLGALGVAALVGGALIHFKIVLPQLSGVVSWASMGGGAATALIMASVKRVKSPGKDQVDDDASKETASKDNENKGVEKNTQREEQIGSENIQKMTQAEIEALSTDELNKIIHHLSPEQLGKLPEKFFADEKLDLRALTSEQINKYLFGYTILPWRTVDVRMQKLPINVLMQILDRLEDDVLQYVPVKTICDPQFVWPSARGKIHSLLMYPACYFMSAGLFPTESKSELIMQHMSSETLNSLMPNLTGVYLLAIVKAQPHTYTNLDWSNVSNAEILRVNIHSETSEETKSRFSKILECLDIDRIHQLIPRMSNYQRECIPIKHLQNDNFDFPAFKEWFSHIFDFGKKIKDLPARQLNKIISDLHGDYLKQISDHALKDPSLDLSGLSEDQVRKMFPIKGLWKEHYSSNINKDHEEVARRLKLLSVTHLNQILSRMSGAQLALLAHKGVLNDGVFEQLDFKLLSEKQLKGLFDYKRGDDDATEKENLFKRLPHHMQAYIEETIPQRGKTQIDLRSLFG